MSWLLVTIILVMVHGSIGSFDDSLRRAAAVASVAIERIASDWAIEQYPNFLTSMITSKSDWDVLTEKFKRKIVQVRHDKSQQNFTLSFTGSSVTAGHDSKFSQSFPLLVLDTMRPVLAELGVQTVVRNVAMGNNPCMPYNLCVQTFAGRDADIVHWEQSYNCGHGDNLRILEQFVRQATSIPTRPLLVFADSDTPNWRRKNCPTNVSLEYVPSAEEAKVVAIYKQSSSGIAAIATLRDRKFSKLAFLQNIIRKYKGTVAIQRWDHSQYQKYKCLGPYVSDWHGNNAKWHPSIHGHRLRAAQLSFFWLAAWRDSILSLIDKTRGGAKIPLLEESDNKLIFPSPLLKSNISDEVQCYTNYEPRTLQEFSLSSLVVKGLNESSEGLGWRSDVYESLLKKRIVNKHGYLDFKIVLYGNQASGPISFRINVRQNSGHIYLCEAPGIWGRSIPGFAPLWKSNMEVYITPSHAQLNTTSWNMSPIEYNHARNDDVCVQVMQNLVPGEYTLSIVPRNDLWLILATLIVP